MNTSLSNKVKVSGKWVLPFYLFTLLPLLTSCNDWLDVDPKSQIREEDHFSREGGFKDQLTGVYTKMTTADMYGLNMGVGFVEVLSHSYDINPNGNWRYANDFDYTYTRSEDIIKQIWQGCYNCIANLNILLRNIDDADPNDFEGNNYHYYKGEALGLRGFLHLELMRLFACAPSMDNNANGVPYVAEYSTDVVPQKTVGETMRLVVKDLEDALDEMQNDTVSTSNSSSGNWYTLTRQRFNYYACCTALARAYLWMGDTQNALKYANIVIDHHDQQFSVGYSWVHYTNMQSTKRNELDAAFTSEQLFQLVIPDWEDVGNVYFHSNVGASVLNPSEATAQDIYELDKGYGNDYRYLKGYEQEGEHRYMAKFWYNEGSTFNNYYPIIRMSEAWYIAAECQKQTNPARAIELLNAVRENRNLYLYPLAETLTADQIQEEIYKEYRKEFIGECGQLFLYYKRLNLSDIKGTSIRGSKAVYVLPIPSNDQEFGGYTN